MCDLNNAASKMLKQVQYHAGCLVTGAMKGTPNFVLLQELEWDTLSSRQQYISLTVMGSGSEFLLHPYPCRITWHLLLYDPRNINIHELALFGMTPFLTWAAKGRHPPRRRLRRRPVTSPLTRWGGRAGQSHRVNTFPVLGGIRAQPPAHASAPPTPAAACIAKVLFPRRRHSGPPPTSNYVNVQVFASKQGYAASSKDSNKTSTTTPAEAEIVKKVDYLENQSRRNNIVIDGIVDDNNKETWADTEVKRDIEIERAHRNGTYNKENPRPRQAVVKLLRYKDKQLILSRARSHLKNTQRRLLRCSPQETSRTSS
ncbi:hypothetical protein Bbelb_361430 [Branchiostoma belcheri]|nr:hypothetical protein Bbelb_361430 [Branchiostoma belcheri]